MEALLHIKCSFGVYLCMSCMSMLVACSPSQPAVFPGLPCAVQVH